MKIRCNTTLISALLLSLCLAKFIPVGVEFASTWRKAYFVMLIIVLCFVFPGNVLPLLLINIRNGGIEWSFWPQALREGEPLALGVLNFLVMLVALLLPIKAFFWRSANSNAVKECYE
jgi:F0F1-type ATP synthase membrane subunit a